MPNPQKSPVHDLRSALELLKTLPGELVSTDVEVDPIAELSGVYRYVGAGGTCQRPTRKNGQAMLFNKVKGYPGIQVAIGLVGSRKRVLRVPRIETRDSGGRRRGYFRHRRCFVGYANALPGR